MQLADKVWRNDAALAQIELTLKAYFTEKFNTPLQEVACSFFESETVLTSRTYGMIRLSDGKTSDLLTAGFVGDSSRSAYLDLVANAWKEIGSSAARAPEAQLVSNIWAALNALFAGPAAAFKPLVVPPKAFLAWDKLPFKRGIRAIVAINGREFTVVIPLPSEEVRAGFGAAAYGLKEASRIMVVDDSATTRKLTRFHLNSAGYFNLVEHVNGADAKAELFRADASCELVLCDWHMPEITGLELLTAVRREPRIAKLPFILVTGERNKEEVVKALSTGVSAYVVKPYEADGLFEAIRRACGAAVVAPKAA